MLTSCSMVAGLSEQTHASRDLLCLIVEFRSLLVVRLCFLNLFTSCSRRAVRMLCICILTVRRVKLCGEQTLNISSHRLLGMENPSRTSAFVLRQPTGAIKSPKETLRWATPSRNGLGVWGQRAAQTTLPHTHTTQEWTSCFSVQCATSYCQRLLQAHISIFAPTVRSHGFK